MQAISHRANLVLIVLATLLLVSCEKAPEEAAEEAADEAVEAEPGRVLEGYTIYAEIPQPVLPEGTVTQTFDSNGGELSLGEARVLVPENVIEGALELLLIPRELDEDLWSERFDRIRPVGEPFSLGIRGSQQLPEEIEFDYSQVSVPDGWQVRLAQIISPDAMTRVRGDRSRGNHRQGGQKERRPANPGSNPTRAFGEQARTFMLSCDREGLRRPLRDLETIPDYSNEYQLVMTREIEVLDVRLDENSRYPRMCIFLVDPPAHGRESYKQRLVTAVKKVLAKADELRFWQFEAVGPESISIVRYPYGANALVGRQHILMHTNLHVQPPYGEVGAIERSAARAYMAMLWVNIANKATIELAFDDANPNATNDWVIEGITEWFFRQVYSGVDWPLPYFDRYPLRPLFHMTDGAFLYWQVLEERYPGTCHAVLTRIRDSLREGRNQFPVNEPAILLSELVDELLIERYDLPLGVTYPMFADALLNDWMESGDLQANLRLTNLTVTNHGFLTNRMEIADRSISELSADILRLTNPVQKGFTTVQGTDARLEANAQVRTALFTLIYGIKHGGETVELYRGALTGRDDEDEGARADISNFGVRGEFREVVVLVANTNRSVWNAESDGLNPATKFARLGNRKDAVYGLDVWTDVEPPRGPLGPAVGGGGGKEHCVGNIPGRRCFGTINQAIQMEEVEPGDTIVVAAGRYRERVKVDKANLTIRGLVPGKVIVQSDSYHTISVEAPGTTIANFVILREGGLGPGNDDTALAIGAPSTFVANNIVIANPGTGIKAGGTADVRLFRNWVTVSNNGIYVSFSPGAQIRENVVVPLMVREFIQTWTLTPTTVEVPGETPENGSTGIYVNSSDHTDVVGNYVGPDIEHPGFSWEHAMMISQVDGLSLTNNQFHIPGLQATVFVRGISNSLISDNRASGSKVFDIRGSESTTLARNTVDSSHTALDVAGIRNFRLFGNRFRAGALAFSATDSEAITVSGDHYESGNRAIYFWKLANVDIQQMTAIGHQQTVRLLNTLGVGIRNSKLTQLTIGGGPFRDPAVAISMENARDTHVESVTIHSEDGGIRAVGPESIGNSFRDIEFYGDDFLFGFIIGDEPAVLDNIHFGELFGPTFAIQSNVPLEMTDVSSGGTRKNPYGRLKRLTLIGTPGLEWQEVVVGETGLGGKGIYSRSTENRMTPYMPIFWSVGFGDDVRHGSDGPLLIEFGDLGQVGPLAPGPSDQINIYNTSRASWQPPDYATGSEIALVLERVERSLDEEVATASGSSDQDTND